MEQAKSTTVPRETVERLATSFGELVALYRSRSGTQAEMIRGCIAKIRQDPRQSYVYRKAQGFSAEAQALKEHKVEVACAFLHLEWLATQLENEAGTLDLSHQPVNIQTLATD